MKTLPKKHPKQKCRVVRGVTIIELTVVIGILLAIITFLLIGSRFYRQSAARSGCIMHLNTLQKSIFSHQNFSGLKAGDPLSPADIIGADKSVEVMPVCPLSNGTYIISPTIPSPNIAGAYCQDYDAAKGTAKASLDHTHPNLAPW